MKRILRYAYLLLFFCSFLGIQNINAQDCAVEVVLVETSECNDMGTYTAEIVYEVDNPTSDSVDVWVNNDYVGQFEISDVLNIDGITPRDNSDYDIILICVNNDTECCTVYEYLHPECGGEEDCFIEIEVQTTDCVDGLYDLFVFYTVVNPTDDLLDVWVNGVYYGNFEINDTGNGEILIEGVDPISGQDEDTILVCVNDNENCCVDLDYPQPDCEDNGECSVDWIEVETECDGDTYTLYIYYGISNPGNESLDLWVNGEFIGFFDISNEPIVLTGFDPSENNIGTVEICVNDTEDCCQIIDYEEPECGDGGDCFIEIGVETTECENGTYTLFLNYFVLNPTNELFDLWVNNEYVGVFEMDPSGEGVIIIEGVEPRENTDYDIVELCVNDNEGCCAIIEYMQPEGCEGECTVIEGVEIEVLECNDMNGNYAINVYFNLSGDANGLIEIYLNGDYAGEWEVGVNSPITIDGIETTLTGEVVLTFCVIAENGYECCTSISYEEPPCGDEECEVQWIEVDVSPCEDGFYTATIYYEISNANTDDLELWLNGEYLGVFQNNGEPIVLDGIIPSDDFIGVIQLCAWENPNCCLTIEYEEPTCEDEPCSVELSVDFTDCDNGLYTLFVVYDIDNPTDDLLDLWVNNEYVGSYEIEFNGTGVIEVNDVEPRENSDYDIVEICVNDNPDCCTEFEFMPPCENMSGDCEVLFIEILETVCNENGTYNLVFQYEVADPGNEFIEVWINEEYQGFYEIGMNNSGVLTIEGIELDPNTLNGLIEVCVNDVPDCCLVEDFAVPNCEGGEECSVNFIDWDFFECDPETGAYNFTIYYDIDNPTNDLLDLWINEEYIGSYEILENGIIEVEGILPIDDLFFIIEICVNDNPDCCFIGEAVLDEPCDELDCNVEFIEYIEGECTGDGTYLIVFEYGIINPGNEFIDVWVNGEFVGDYEIGPNNSGVITIDGIESIPGEVGSIMVCVNDSPDCCFEIEFIQPECTELQDGELPYEILSDAGSSEIILTPKNGAELQYELYNADGRLIQNMDGVEAEHMISLRQPGIFIIKIAADRKVFYHKMLSIQ